MKDKIKALNAFCEKNITCVNCPLYELKCDKGIHFNDGMSEEDINLAYQIAFGAKEEEPHIKDSGTRREFNTGAVRDIQEGKGRCDLLPLGVVANIIPINHNHHRPIVYIEHFVRTSDTFNLVSALERFREIRKWDLPTMLLELSKHFEEGAKKYGERNWEKGIPTHCYIDSAVRHYLKWLRGDKDEPHDRAFCWNILCCIWTCQNMPELNDYPIKKEGGGE